MKRSSSGFTLIELLVAIMILTLFMTAAMGAVRIASRSTTAGVVRADTTEEMRVVSDFLRRQFAQLPYMTIGEGKDERLAFAADQKNLRFVAPAPLYSRGAGLMIYTLAAKRTDDGREVLTLSYAPFDPGSERFEAIRSTAPMILTTGFETIEFEYFGAEMEASRPLNSNTSARRWKKTCPTGRRHGVKTPSFCRALYAYAPAPNSAVQVGQTCSSNCARV
jgi:general secretion pathway protein J